jgi:hypothetical protein
MLKLVAVDPFNSLFIHPIRELYAGSETNVCRFVERCRFNSTLHTNRFASGESHLSIDKPGIRGTSNIYQLQHVIWTVITLETRQLEYSPSIVVIWIVISNSRYR